MNFTFVYVTTTTLNKDNHKTNMMANLTDSVNYLFHRDYIASVLEYNHLAGLVAGLVRSFLYLSSISSILIAYKSSGCCVYHLNLHLSTLLSPNLKISGSPSCCAHGLYLHLLVRERRPRPVDKQNAPTVRRSRPSRPGPAELHFARGMEGHLRAQDGQPEEQSEGQ